MLLPLFPLQKYFSLHNVQCTYSEISTYINIYKSIQNYIICSCFHARKKQGPLKKHHRVKINQNGQIYLWMEKNFTKAFKQILPRSEHITEIFQQIRRKKWKISVVILFIYSQHNGCLISM